MGTSFLGREPATEDATVVARLRAAGALLIAPWTLLTAWGWFLWTITTISSRAVVLELEPEEHRRRLRERADRMLDAGWRDEVEALLAAGHERGSIPFRTIGYAAVAEWMAGGISRADALACILRDTWGYARRQRTWFRHQLPADTVRLDAAESPDRLADLVIELARGSDAAGGNEFERTR